MEAQQIQSEELTSTTQTDQQQPPPDYELQRQEQGRVSHPDNPELEKASEKEGCRGSARCIAYCEIVVSIMVAALAIASGILTAIFLGSAESEEVEVEVSAYVILVLDVLTVLFNVIAVFSATVLLSATNKATPPLEAIGKAKCWFYYTIFLTVFHACAGVIGVSLTTDVDDGRGQSFSITHFPDILLQIIALCVVYKFVNELKAATGGEMESKEVPQVSVVTMPSTDDVEAQ